MSSNTSITYHIRQSTFSVTYGDITKMNVDVIVSSDDNRLSMGGGVSQSIRRAAGFEFYQSTRNIPKLHLGDVYVSSAGNLLVKHIFHLITIDLTSFQSISVALIKKSVFTALQLCESYGCRSIAFPAIATGVAGIPFEEAAYAMTSAIAEYLTQNSTALFVTIALFARQGIQQSQLDQFYDKAVAASVHLYVSQSLDLQLSEILKNTQHTELNDAQKNIQHIIQTNLQNTVNQFYSHTPVEITNDVDVINRIVEAELKQEHNKGELTQLIQTEILAVQLLLNQLYYESQSSFFAADIHTTNKIYTYESRLTQLQNLLNNNN